MGRYKTYLKNFIKCCTIKINLWTKQLNSLLLGFHIQLENLFATPTTDKISTHTLNNQFCILVKVITNFIAFITIHQYKNSSAYRYLIIFLLGESCADSKEIVSWLHKTLINWFHLLEPNLGDATAKVIDTSYPFKSKCH